MRVDPEFCGLIPPLSDEERRQLEENLLADGCRDPLVVWSNAGDEILLDGHHRLEMCRRHRLAYRTVAVDLPDREAAKDWIERHQLGRRNLPRDAFMLLLGRRYNRAKQRHGGQVPGSRGHIDPSIPSHATARRLAAEHHVAERTVRRAGKLAEQIEAIARQQPDIVAEVMAGKKRLTAAVRAKAREEKLQALQQAAAASPAPATDWRIIAGDCLDELVKLPAASARLVFADPPYNIGIDYGDHYDDRQDPQEYLAWCRRWIEGCLSVLTPDGSLWLLICDEYAAELTLQLKAAGLTIRNWIKWYETFGVNCPNKFNRTSRHLLYAVKDPRRFVFDPQAVCRPSDRQTQYNDARANPGGKTWDDVWRIPRLVGTSQERLPGFPTQLPLALLEPIVRCASCPGDLVVDPFSGSGTTGVAAILHGRRYVGIERSERFAALSRLRLQGVGR